MRCEFPVLSLFLSLSLSLSLSLFFGRFGALSVDFGIPPSNEFRLRVAITI